MLGSSRLIVVQHPGYLKHCGSVATVHARHQRPQLHTKHHALLGTSSQDENPARLAAAASSMSATTTLQPSCPKQLAHAAPMPFPPPAWIDTVLP